MASRWVITYDLDTSIDQGNPAALGAASNAVRGCLAAQGFSEMPRIGAWSTPDDGGGLDRVHEALRALGGLPERRAIRRMHAFRIDGAVSDVLPIVDQRPSDGTIDPEV